MPLRCQAQKCRGLYVQVPNVLRAKVGGGRWTRGGGRPKNNRTPNALRI